MISHRISGAGRRGRRGLPLSLAVAVSAAMAGSPAQAAQSPVHAAARTAAARTASAAGTISTVAGGVGGPGQATSVGIGQPCGVSFAGGRLYIGALAVRTVDPGTDHLTTPAGTDLNDGPLGDGSPATRARLDACGVSLDHAGNLVIADLASARVQVVAAGAGTFYGQQMTSGDIYTVAGDGTKGLSGDGGPATKAELQAPVNAEPDGSGNLVVADSGRAARAGKPGVRAVIRVVAASSGIFYGQPMTAGDIYTVVGAPAGDASAAAGGPAAKAALGAVIGDVRLDSAGNLLIADASHDNVRVVAVSSGTFYGQPMTAGNIYTIAGDAASGFSGDGGPATAASLAHPVAVAADGHGNVLIADAFNDRVRLLAVASGTFYGQPMSAGDIYTVAGESGVSGQAIPAVRAELSPAGIAEDGSGNLIAADNDRVRVVAASSGTFYGVAMTAGDIYTVAGDGESGFSGDGGPAAAAELSRPQDVTADSTGNLLIADTGNERVRVVAVRTGTFYGVAMTAGDIYTVAGQGRLGFSGDGGPALRAALNNPLSLAADGAGDLLISDSGNHRVRMASG